ncbi:MAG: hypothetical protein ACPH9F_04405 [Candidatus Poseidoniaceae archaeon]
MVKRSEPDEIALDELMQESMKEMGKGEVKHNEIVENPQIETPKTEQEKPQFGFKLDEVKTPDSFVVATQEKEPKREPKKQVILDKPSQSLDDDIIVDW